MGIAGLLGAMQPATTPTSLQAYEGRTLIIDGATLLYKAAYVSAWEIALGLPPATWLDASWRYIGRRLDLFHRHSITPVFVLDGRRSPLKRETDAKRNNIRQGYLRDGHAAHDRALRLPEGHPQRAALLDRARDCFQKAVKAPKELVLAVLARLRDCGVELLVAPYEADAQVAYLVRKGYGDAVVTEDSDLIAYAALAPTPFPILFKLDATGACVELTYDPAELSSRQGNMGPFVRSLRFFAGPHGGRLFLQASVFAGCDYLASINGIGPITAWELAVKCRTVPSHNRLLRMVRNLALKKRRDDAPRDYIERAKQAELLFAYHLCYDPHSGRCVPYLPLRYANAQGQQGKNGREGAAPEGEGEGEQVKGGEAPTGSVEKEEDEAAVAAAAGVIVIDDDDEEEEEKGQWQGKGARRQQRGPAVPVLSRPPREEWGLEALDLPLVEPGTDLAAVLGEALDEQQARGVAEARLHPETLQPLRFPRIPSRGNNNNGGDSFLQQQHHHHQEEEQWEREEEEEDKKPSPPMARPSSSSSSSSSSGGSSGGLPSFLQQQHAQRVGAPASFLSPPTSGHAATSSSSSGRQGAGFRPQREQRPPQQQASEEAPPLTFADDTELQDLYARLREQIAAEQQEQQERERARQRQWQQRGLKRRGHGGAGAEAAAAAAQTSSQDEWDTEALLASMSPQRWQRVRIAAATAEAMGEDEDGMGFGRAGAAAPAAAAAAAAAALASPFPSSSPEFCYTLSAASASNSPQLAAGGGGGGGGGGSGSVYKENVSPLAQRLPALAEEEGEEEEEMGSAYAQPSQQQQQQQQQRPVKNPFAVVTSSSPFQRASASASKRPAPPSPTHGAVTAAASAPGISASAAIADEDDAPPAAAAAAAAASQGAKKKKRGVLPSFFGPKAPAPLPAPAPVPAPAPARPSSSGGGGGGGKGKKGGKKGDKNSNPLGGLKKFFLPKTS